MPLVKRFLLICGLISLPVSVAVGEFSQVTTDSGIYEGLASQYADGVSVLQESKPIKTGDAAVLGISGKGTLEDMVSEYSRQVRNMYGSAYGSSEILTDYFTELKTKD